MGAGPVQGQVHGVSEGIVAALQRAVADAQDSQQASKTGTRYPFGVTLMARKYEALVTALEDMGEVMSVPMKGSPFRLVLIEGCLLYPFKYANDATVAISEARISDRLVSDRVRGIFGKFSPSSYVQDGLFDGEEEAESETVALNAAMQALPPDTKLVLVAFACNEKAGLINAWWGEAELADDYGRLNWHGKPEEIRLPVELQAGGRPRAVLARDADTAAARFDSGDMPGLMTGLRTPSDGEAAGEDEVSPAPETAHERN
jgi:hypothetical protein